MDKARMDRSLPLPAVTALYRCFFDDTMALARSLDAVEVAIMCPGSDVGELAGLAGDAVRAVAQKGEGLSGGLAPVVAPIAEACRRRRFRVHPRPPALPRFFF